MGKLTGASAAKKAARAQEAALEEQTKQAQAQAAEAARQASIQTTQAQARQAATEQAEAMAQQDAKAAEAPEVSMGTSDGPTARKRGKFQAGSTSIPSVSI